MLYRRGKRDIATMILEMGPLYDPHDFWDSEPVPKMGEVVTEEQYDMPIEQKTLEDVNKEPLNLPQGSLKEAIAGPI